MNLQNIINSDKYIISQELQEVLLQHNWAHKSRAIVKDQPGIYLVMFRILNNEKKTLLYNYIYYNSLLEYCLVSYIRSTQYNVEYREIGVFLSVVDEYFLKDRINKLCMCEDTNSYQIIEKSCFKDHYELLNLITRLIFLANYEVMSKFAYSNDYANFIRLILNTIPRFDADNKFELESVAWNKSISIINASLFVVHDMNRFIKNIKASGFNVNQGPQPWTGQINSISSFLNSFHVDFRNSLYHHNKYHMEKGTIYLGSQIPRSKFTFNNIHMNLGNVRWYSTSKRPYENILRKTIHTKTTPVKEPSPIKEYRDLDNKLIKDFIFKDNRNKSGIYRWKNLKNGKTYLGSSINLSKRLIKYYDENALNKNNMLINKAILKYGRGNFSLEIMEYCSNKDIIKREQYYLDLLKPEYNILKIAGSSYGYKHSEASLIKLRARVITKETLDKMKTRIHLDDTKIKISKTLGICVKATDIDKKNFIQYDYKTQAAKLLGVSEHTIRRYIKSKKLLFARYSITEINKNKR